MKPIAPVAVLAAAYLLVPLLLGGNAYLMTLLVSALIIAGIALAWALLGNLGGMVSFGHAAFFGVGAYTSALLSMQAGLPVLLAIPLGGLGAALAAVAVLPALRLSGPYFALAILAYAHIFRILATELKSLTGGSAGILGIPGLPTLGGLELGSRNGQYLLVLTVVLAFIALYRAIWRSDYGLALRAMHDSEDATRVVGVNSTLLKAAMLFVSAFMTGTIGALNAHVINFLDPDYAFSGAWTIVPIAAAIFGGYRTLGGPLLGAIAVYLLDQLLFKALFPSGHQIILGVLLGAMILLSPNGLLPWISRRLQRRPATEVRHAAA
ncbi:branched-chain amino acid ABC transporter permease [Plasticicumulans acidivorans]|uniref:Amino acid/amide ABC transporter membrane protein 2 (HAAT family) n=1 Tax=Plasticicumulans acidivorans TaxID=886464 RepID=A0A317MTP5_9GAMM|nr:branched-chain amino acid ABC transporter permease [Plasticicumulans acidivorans]PWV57762.1 amino acid/amide ABC transporter membrane protein 2 (HAAT family) [Plasticicumulans acidivorans]